MIHFYFDCQEKASPKAFEDWLGRHKGNARHIQYTIKEGEKMDADLRVEAKGEVKIGVEIKYQDDLLNTLNTGNRLLTQLANLQALYQGKSYLACIGVSEAKTYARAVMICLLVGVRPKWFQNWETFFNWAWKKSSSPTHSEYVPALLQHAKPPVEFTLQEETLWKMAIQVKGISPQLGLEWVKEFKTVREMIHILDENDDYEWYSSLVGAIDKDLHAKWQKVLEALGY